jgi:TolB protein
LTKTPYRASEPTGQIVFTSDAPDADTGHRGQLVVIDVATGGRRVLTSGDMTWYDPQWSPDSDRIACGGARLDSGIGDLWLMDSEGGGHLRLTSRDVHEAAPYWLVDGERLLFGVYGQPRWSLWMLHLETGRQEQVEEASYGGAVAPDGRRLAYECETGLCVRALDEGERRPLPVAEEGVNQIYDPVWSPDGETIAFVCRFERGGLGKQNEICRITADGSGFRRLTDNDAYDDSPSWSPNGAYIAFASNVSGDFEVYLMRADGSGKVNLTQSPDRDDRDPDWTPD